MAPYAQQMCHSSRSLQSIQLASSPSQNIGLSDSLESRSIEEVQDTETEVEVEVESTVVQQSRPRIEACSCDCHTPLALRTPQWLEPTVGTMLVRYSRNSLGSCQSCSQRSCSRGSQGILKTHYSFPGWFMRRMMCLQYSWSPFSGHNVSLRTPRTVSSRSNVFLFAQHSNIKGMRRLFEQNLASPFDVSFEEGRSPLHVSISENA